MDKKTTFKSFLLGLPFVQRVLSLSKRVILPGFEGVSLFEAGSFFIENMNNINLSERCAAVTYNFLTALAPTLLFLFTLVPYLPSNDVQITILHTLRLLLPNRETYESVSQVIMDFMNKEQRSLLSFSLMLTLFFASNGMMSLMRYFDKDQKVYVARGSFKRRWAAIKLTLLFTGMILLSIVVIILQTQYVNDLLLIIFNNVTLIKVTSLVLIFIIIYSTISCIYIYGPSLTHRFKYVSAGALLATIICIIATLIFFYAVNNFLNYNKIYGSLGTLIAFLVWISITTRIIMLGYDLNVSILMGKIHKYSEDKSKSGA